MWTESTWFWFWFWFPEGSEAKWSVWVGFW